MTVLHTGRIPGRRNGRALTLWSLVAGLTSRGRLQCIRRQGVFSASGGWQRGFAADVGLWRLVQRSAASSGRRRLGRREQATKAGGERSGSPPLLRIGSLLHSHLFFVDYRRASKAQNDDVTSLSITSSCQQSVVLAVFCGIQRLI